MGMLLKILVVDDDRLSRRIMEKNLASQGYKVITAEDGEKALEILTEDADISLVITDWNMPRMDGVELCRAARALKRSRYLPLILLTARGEKQDLIEGLNAGADAFIFQATEELEKIREPFYLVLKKKKYLDYPQYLKQMEII